VGKFKQTLRLPNPENRGVGENSMLLSFTGTKLYCFEVPMSSNANF